MPEGEYKVPGSVFETCCQGFKARCVVKEFGLRIRLVKSLVSKNVKTHRNI